MTLAVNWKELFSHDISSERIINEKGDFKSIFLVIEDTAIEYTSIFNYIEIMKPLWLLEQLLKVTGNSRENTKLLLYNFYLILNSDFYETFMGFKSL